MLTFEEAHRADGGRVISDMRREDVSADLRARTERRARDLVRRLREEARPGLMETFLAEYGLSTDEGVALMCLAEALLRVPDAETVDALIEDKIAPSEWGEHLGRSNSSLVNASTWALMLTGKVLDTDDATGVTGALRGMIKRLGEPVIRRAVAQAMREMGEQFVLGETIKGAIRRSQSRLGAPYTYSYDMLGEAALTAADAQRYFDSYWNAIVALGPHCTSDDIRKNPGISIKLSALHPRYDEFKRERVMRELVPRVRELAKLAASYRMGLNIDAEEADRLELSLDIFGAVIAEPELSGWGGLGMVIQAYGQRALPAIHRVAELSAGERCMVRLVKGAYWDSEIKRAQVDGLDGFPVFARKAETDASYILCARELLSRVPAIYPQFATHNAHTAAAVLELASDLGVAHDAWEFQRLHGMGDSLHRMLMADAGVACRVYAPVGAHRDLLAYLVRRLLENGANSSFVSQVLDRDVSVETVISDPFAQLERHGSSPVRKPEALFGRRRNSRGWDLRDRTERQRFETARGAWADAEWRAKPLVVGTRPSGKSVPVTNPARPEAVVGHVLEAGEALARKAVGKAKVWDAPVAERARILRAASDLLEANSAEIFALLAREAGKCAPDAVAEVREAVDFLRYYADEAERRGETTPAGVVVAISPWNFPLAIFVGQVAAALATGNAVIAKPAETTPLIAHRAVEWLREAGVPEAALQFVPGEGRTVGAALTSTPGVDGVVFTGSTATAQAINRAMAQHLAPEAFLIAETGGLNAMIVDSTALPEQAVRDIVASAFQSAGQRCSALRCLYLQDEVADGIVEMLRGAMDELQVGDPWDLATDVGPVITAAARREQLDYLAARSVSHQIDAPDTGHFVPPSLVEVDGIGELEREVFGPVLHVARFRARDIRRVVADINATGYGLTFGLHTRIDDRVEDISRAVHAGNIYVNRNQIGAVVGSQPFGGEGLSGTGPKAGGPHYLDRFIRPDRVVAAGAPGAMVGTRTVGTKEAQAALDALPPVPTQALSAHELPGPTGESNVLSTYPRGAVLCLGPDAESADVQAGLAHLADCPALRIAPGATGHHAIDGTLVPPALQVLEGFRVVAFWGDEAQARPYREALAARPGAILPLVMGRDVEAHCIRETHVCVDTTAAGGNASLLAAVSEELGETVGDTASGAPVGRAGT